MDLNVHRREQLPANHPKVRFAPNKELEVWKINEFWEREGKGQRGPAGFRHRLIETYPELSGIEKLRPELRRARIAEFVGSYYSQHEQALTLAAEEISLAWGKYAPGFFTTAGKIFKGLEWPPGKYVGYVTICPPFPRFLHDKTFQVPDGPTDRCIRVTAHELTHFLFYEYIRRRYLPHLDNTVEREMNKLLEGRFIIPLWESSEVFNICVLIPKDFGVGGQASDQAAKFYHNLAPFIPVFEARWSEAGGDIDRLFDLLENRNVE